MGAGQRSLLSFLLFSALFFGSPDVARSRPFSVDPDFSEVAAQVKTWVDAGIYPGAGLLIGRGGNIVLERYYGVYGPNSRVPIASAGKWLAAATIASLVDSGDLRWDDPASRYIPDLPAQMGKATLRQLLSHVAGYADYQPSDRPRDHYATLRESVDHIRLLPPDAAPGARFRYGGLAMQVAGRMAEIATGKDWETLFQDRLARPLGMTGTGFTPVPEEEGFSPMLGGSAHTTLRDYGRFLAMIAQDGLFEGRSILSPAAIAELQRDQVGRAVVSQPEYVDQARARIHHGIYGLGEWREELDPAGRALLVSSPGWAGAYPWVDRRTGSWGFVLAKVNVPRARQLGFSSFLSGPVLPMLVRDAIDDAARRDVKRGYAMVPGGRLYWEASGKGPPLILLHGHSFDRTMWDPQMAALGRHFRVIRYDMRGYGRSSLPQEGVNRLHADDLVALMDALGIGKAHLVGLSLGGAVAVDMAILHPDRLLTVTAASGDIFDFYPAPDEAWTKDGIAQRQAEIAALREGGLQAYKRDWLERLTSRGGGCVNAIRPKLWEMISKWSAWQPLHLEPRLLLGHSALDRLKAKPPHVPIQILTGDADSHNPNLLLKALPNTPRLIIPNAGHVMNLENPDAFNEAVIRFALSGKAAGGADLANHISACPDNPS